MKDLKANFGFKPLYNGRALVASSEDREPTKFYSTRKAAKAIGMGHAAIRYARDNAGRDFVKRFENENIKVFFIK